MARAPLTDKTSSDFDAINLGRALARLELKILHPGPESRLRCSSYERTKTAANVEYARDLLLRLERSNANIKVQSRKQAAQNDLTRQRALIKRLNDRLYALGQEDDGMLSSASDGDEDILGEYLQHPTHTISTSPPRSSNPDRRTPSAVPEMETTSTLRSRLASPSAAASWTTAHPFSSFASPSEASVLSVPTLLESHSSTQAQLTSSLVQLATTLKESSLALSASLADDNARLSITAAALDKNTDGMASASKKMGMLRSMSEGRWWWGRMVLYACIVGLWLVALAIVFVGPKLRFSP
ncbi:hypothetical protein MMC19_004411 [Ptychographa xylographoides]|nr:hypothetical protein [Ptychographa xylographoides]